MKKFSVLCSLAVVAVACTKKSQDQSIVSSRPDKRPDFTCQSRKSENRIELYTESFTEIHVVSKTGKRLEMIDSISARTTFLEGLPPVTRTLFVHEEGDVVATLDKKSGQYTLDFDGESDLECKSGADLPAAAAPQASKTLAFECTDVGGTEEWRINVDLKSGKASFFDNDETVEVALKEQKSVETTPPQQLYIFEGKDAGGARGSKLRIQFNEIKLSAGVTLALGTSEEETLEAEGGCRAQ